MIPLGWIGAATGALLRVVLVLWFVAFLGKTAWEIRRFYLLYHYWRGHIGPERLPPLREELPDGSVIELLRQRR